MIRCGVRHYESLAYKPIRCGIRCHKPLALRMISCGIIQGGGGGGHTLWIDVDGKHIGSREESHIYMSDQYEGHTFWIERDCIYIGSREMVQVSDQERRHR